MVINTITIEIFLWITLPDWQVKIVVFATKTTTGLLPVKLFFFYILIIDTVVNFIVIKYSYKHLVLHYNKEYFFMHK